jgi:predicted aspartyl protease
MTEHFNPTRTPIVLEGFITGPRGDGVAKLALDTGASRTLIRASILTAVGFDLSAATRHRNIRAATGGARAPVVELRQLLVLGQARTNFEVAAHELPPAVTYDGLVGLDFLRGLVLTLDFARGLISLDPPRPWWQFWR